MSLIFNKGQSYAAHGNLQDKITWSPMQRSKKLKKRTLLKVSRQKQNQLNEVRGQFIFNSLVLKACNEMDCLTLILAEISSSRPINIEWL